MPLVAAAFAGHAEVVKALLAAGALLDTGVGDPPDDPDEPYDGDSNPLLYAASEAHLETVPALIEAGADLTAKLGSSTALDYAREGKRLGSDLDRPWDETIEVLRKAGARGARRLGARRPASRERCRVPAGDLSRDRPQPPGPAGERRSPGRGTSTGNTSGCP